MDLPMEIPSEFLHPIVSGWVRKLSAAQRAREPWSELARECRMFYNHSAAAMWDPQYSKKFWSNVKAPQFRITLNLAFEYVAVFMPHLMWEVPHREVSPKRLADFPAELMGGEESPLFQMYQQERQQSTAVDNTVAALLEHWLNYTSREMPGGGLAAHGQLATLDALLVGRGCQVVRPYKMPGSDKQLTGCFNLSPERLLTDPDYPNFNDSKWIAIRHDDPHWEVERRFELEPNSLKNRSSLESMWSQGETSHDASITSRRLAGQTNDIVVWWEIFSKMGVGSRMTDMHQGIKATLEKAVGDYAYLAIAPNVPYPLNCPTEVLRNGASMEEVGRKFRWPIPLWTDGRYPVEVFDLYDNTDPDDPSASWPIPPLAPAMGEIKFLNFIIPWLTQLIWNGSRDFWAVAGPHLQHFKQRLQEGDHYTILDIPTGVEDVRKAIAQIGQAEVRSDLWRIVEVVTDLFRRRTGMVDVMYGKNEGGTQSRTAEDALAKKESSGARLKMMQNLATAYHSRLAAAEAYVTRLFVTSRDVEPLFGQVVSMLWGQHIESTDVERVVRQMDYTVAASSIRFPNRERDLANWMQFVQYQLALVQQYSGQTGDYAPANGLLEKFGELHDMDMEGLYFPPPDPEQQQAEQQMQQQQQQLEQAKLQADLQKSQAEIEKAQIELQGKMLDARASQEQAQIDQAGALMELEQDQDEHEQEQQQGTLEFLQKFRFADLQNQQKIDHLREMAKVKLQVARSQRAASTNGSKSNGNK